MEILLKIMRSLDTFIRSVLNHELTQKVLAVLKPVIEVLKPIMSRVKYLIIKGFKGFKSIVSNLFTQDSIKTLFNGENVRQKIVTALLFLGVLFSFTRCGGDDAKEHVEGMDVTTVKSETLNHDVKSKVLYPKDKTVAQQDREKLAKELEAKQKEAEKRLMQEKEAKIKAEKKRLAEIAAKEKAEAEIKLQKETEAKKRVWLKEKTAEVQTAMGVIKDQNKFIADSRAGLEEYKSQLAHKISEKSDVLQKIVGASTLLSTKQALFETDFKNSQENIELKFADLKKARELLLAEQSSFEEKNADLDNRKAELEKATKELEIAEAKLLEDIKAFELEKDQVSQQIADINSSKLEISKATKELEVAKAQLENDKNTTNAELEKLEIAKVTFEKQKAFLEAKELNITHLIDEKEAIFQKVAKVTALAAHQAEFDKAAKDRESEEVASKENEKISLLTKELNTTTIELNSVKASLEATSGELEAIKLDFDATSKELVAVKADLNSTSMELSKLNESAQSTNTQIKADIDAANAELAKTKESLENTKAELAKANETVKSASADKTALIAATASLAKQKSALDEANKEIQRLNQKIEELLKQQKAEEVARLKVKQQQDQKRTLLDRLSLTNVQFKYNSTELTPSSIQRLEEAAAFIIKNSGYNYEIQGHTDAHGNEAYNLKLSTSRAEAVKSYLISRGVDASILVATGFGSSKPIADNSTNEGRLKNRRVVFEIIE
jgi:outer membrane protein OmpA-like peptidoglycan-associated protein